MGTIANQNTITSANSVFALAVLGLFDTPVLIQGFGTDDAFDTESLAPAETQMGVDGNFSAGWVPVAVPVNITLQADSDSNVLFETWYAFEQQQQEKFVAQGSILLPATGRKYTLTRGFLTAIAMTPGAKKVLQPRRYSVTFGKITPANF
jgi:hypothetical protein